MRSGQMQPELHFILVWQTKPYSHHSRRASDDSADRGPIRHRDYPSLLGMNSDPRWGPEILGVRQQRHKRGHVNRSELCPKSDSRTAQIVRRNQANHLEVLIEPRAVKQGPSTRSQCLFRPTKRALMAASPPGVIIARDLLDHRRDRLGVAQERLRHG